MVSPWRWLAILTCVALACALLQPNEPQSAIATCALVLALYLAYVQ